MWGLLVSNQSFDLPRTTLTCSYAFKKHPHKSYDISYKSNVCVCVWQVTPQIAKVLLSFTLVPHFLRASSNVYFTLSILNDLILALSLSMMWVCSSYPFNAFSQPENFYWMNITLKLFHRLCSRTWVLMIWFNLNIHYNTGRGLGVV